jgi:hypothetical protein
LFDSKTMFSIRYMAVSFAHRQHFNFLAANRQGREVSRGAVSSAISPILLWQAEHELRMLVPG